MVMLRCSNYGFDYDFASEGNEAYVVTERFGRHICDEHGIEYSKEALMQIILRKNDMNFFLIFIKTFISILNDSKI